MGISYISYIRKPVIAMIHETSTFHFNHGGFGERDQLWFQLLGFLFHTNCSQRQALLELTTSADKISNMSTMASGHTSKPTKSTVFCSDGEFDGMDQDDYGDFALGTSKAAHGKGSKKTKMTGNNGPYSTKHTRLRESRKSGK